MVDNVNLLEGVRLIQFVVANDDHPVINVEIIGIPLLDLEKGWDFELFKIGMSKK